MVTRSLSVAAPCMQFISGTGSGERSAGMSTPLSPSSSLSRCLLARAILRVLPYAFLHRELLAKGLDHYISRQTRGLGRYLRRYGQAGCVDLLRVLRFWRPALLTARLAHRFPLPLLLRTEGDRRRGQSLGKLAVVINGTQPPCVYQRHLALAGRGGFRSGRYHSTILRNMVFRPGSDGNI